MPIFNKKSVYCLIAATIILGLSFPAIAAQTESSMDYVAKVNDRPISQDDLDRKFKLIKERYERMGVPLDDAKLNEFKENILKSLIEQEVLYQEATALGIKVDSEEINAELDNFKKKFETEAAFQKQISDMGYTEDAILSQIKESMTIQKYIDEKIMPTISITDEEIKNYYDTHPEEFEMPERVRASHILLKVEPNASDVSKAETLKDIKDIKNKIDNGGNFAELAAENSECPSSAKGGDLGFFARGQMVKPFEDAAFALAPGEVSDVVETRFGYHLIKSEEKENATNIAYDDIKEKLGEKLKEDKFKEMFPTFIESIKADYKIEIPGNMPAKENTPEDE